MSVPVQLICGAKQYVVASLRSVIIKPEQVILKELRHCRRDPDKIVTVPDGIKSVIWKEVIIIRRVSQYGYTPLVHVGGTEKCNRS